MATVPENAVESDDESSKKSGAAELNLQGKTDKEAAAETGEQDSAKKERCAQLMAQGQVALAQAEGCGGGDQPIWAGTIVSFTQTTAPASRYLPDNDNAFYAMSLYFAPRLTLTKKWALNADISLAYEATKPDDTSKRYKVQTSDTRLLLNGNLGSIGGFTFTGGPRVSIPTSEPSWAAEVYAGLGAGLNIIKSFEVLEGLSFIGGGAYNHTFSGRLTRKIRDGEAPPCKTVEGGVNNTTECAAGNLRVVQDSVRAVGAASLNFTSALNMQLSYVYGWSFAKPFVDGADELPLDTGSVTVGDNGVDDTRMRRVGSFGLSVSYQPLPWFIASVQGNTSVCYDSPFGGQSAFGGCSGGLNNKDFWTSNPIANKFSTVGLQFTVPVDALYDAIRSSESESKSAKLEKAKPRI